MIINFSFLDHRRVGVDILWTSRRDFGQRHSSGERERERERMNSDEQMNRRNDRGSSWTGEIISGSGATSLLYLPDKYKKQQATCLPSRGAAATPAAPSS